jgi:hypothetical protein
MALLRDASAAVVGPLSPAQRRQRALDIRLAQAQANHDANPALPQTTNGDEESLGNYIGCYSKGLPHNTDGEVVTSAYGSLIAALTSGEQEAFERIPLGGTTRLTNPLGGIAYDVAGPDGQAFSVPPPPRFVSREIAAEIAENYWMALLRDVPFSEYPLSPIAHAAAADLTLFGADAKLPKNSAGRVTTELLFRGLTPGDRVGPYMSQFFYLPCPFGQNDVRQLARNPLPGVDFMTDFDEWLAVQNGVQPRPLALENTARYMRDGRALSEWVHVDVLFQAYFMAFLVLASLGAPLDPASPYAGSGTQMGFASFGGPHIAALLAEVSTRALHATWFQKWFAHRRLRPEAYAGAVHVRLNRGGSANRFPVHDEILASISSQSRLGGYLPSGSALLPMAFPEGSPTHPSFTAGHATVAGACTTVLKTFFDESWVLPTAAQPHTDGLSLVPYEGELTVGGELNKVASNVAIGRNIAGVHWRSDATASLRLGEEIAIHYMREHNSTYHERLNGMALTRFDGTRVTI